MRSPRFELGSQDWQPRVITRLHYDRFVLLCYVSGSLTPCQLLPSSAKPLTLFFRVSFPAEGRFLCNLLSFEKKAEWGYPNFLRILFIFEDLLWGWKTFLCKKGILFESGSPGPKPGRMNQTTL